MFSRHSWWRPARSGCDPNNDVEFTCTNDFFSDVWDSVRSLLDLSLTQRHRLIAAILGVPPPPDGLPDGRYFMSIAELRQKMPDPAVLNIDSCSIYSRKCGGALLSMDPPVAAMEQIPAPVYVKTLDGPTNAELCTRVELCCRKWVEWAKANQTRMWRELTSTIACSVVQEVLLTLIESGESDWKHLDEDGDAINQRSTSTGPGREFLTKLSPVPWGVLGTQLAHAHKSEKTRAPMPDETMAVVDPAGLPFIQEMGPGGAAGASGTIYQWIELSNQPEFPEEVKKCVNRECAAKLHVYAAGNVIHSVGPDFRQTKWSKAQGGTREMVIKALSSAYRHILSEFVTSGLKRLRLLPVSGGIFSGEFGPDMPRITVEALRKGFSSLDGTSQACVLGAEALELCIFMERDYDPYSEAVSEGRTGIHKTRSRNLVVKTPSSRNVGKQAAPRVVTTGRRQPLFQAPTGGGGLDPDAGDANSSDSTCDGDEC